MTHLYATQSGWLGVHILYSSSIFCHTPNENSEMDTDSLSTYPCATNSDMNRVRWVAVQPPSVGYHSFFMLQTVYRVAPLIGMHVSSWETFKMRTRTTNVTFN